MVLEAGLLRSGCLNGQVLVRTLFPGCRLLTSLVSSRGREQRGKPAPRTPVRALIPFVRAPPSWPHLVLITSPEAPSPDTITVGEEGRASTYQSGRDTNIQSITVVVAKIIPCLPTSYKGCNAHRWADVRPSTTLQVKNGFQWVHVLTACHCTLFASSSLPNLLKKERSHRWETQWSYRFGNVRLWGGGEYWGNLFWKNKK